jgi:Leucine-rich repeat (LRR) protein
MSKKALTLETIMLRTKSDKINCIKNLNLWGNDLEDVSCLVNVPNLEVVSLSVNKIRSLKPFAKLSNLKDLYLRSNQISSFSEINYLTSCKLLRTLTLNENPIADIPNYRKKIIQLLPQLIKLDEKVITIEEKTAATDDNDLTDQDEMEEETIQEEVQVQPNNNKQEYFEENKKVNMNKKQVQEGKSKGKKIIK